MITSFLRLSSSIIGLAFTTVVAAHSFATEPQKVPHLSLDESYEQLTRELFSFVQRNHYQPRDINDAFAYDVYQQFLKVLDYQRLYLAKSDLVNYNRLATELDQLIPAGNIDALEEIFNLVQQRKSASIHYVLSILENPDHQFDFTANEFFNIDPETRPRSQNSKDLEINWTKLLKNEYINGLIAGEDQQQITKRLLKRYRSQAKRITQVSQRDMYDAIMTAITRVTDPHTSYLSPRQVEDFNIDMSLSLQGIGAVLEIDTDYTKVRRLVVGGPADKAGGLNAGDYIVGVAQDNQDIIDVVGWRLDDVVNLIRGPRDSLVRLEIIEDGDFKKAPKEISIVRDTVELEDQAATKEIIKISTLGKNNKIIKVGVIQLPTFYMDFEAYRNGDPDFRSSTRDIWKLVGELREENIDALIIDLRNNGGGSLTEANQLTSLFIDTGPIVQVRYNNGQIKTHTDRQRGVAYTGPMAVMVSRASASASEIFAGAMQDYQRALIVGSQTHGKGTVQSLADLSLGQVKFTHSKFYRVTGASTQHRGIIPDIELPDLIDAQRHGEANLDFVMPWDSVAALDHPRYFDFPALVPLLAEMQAERTETDPDLRYISNVKAYRRNEPKVLSLNLADRKQLDETTTSWYLDAINDLRGKKGLAPVENTDDHELKYDEIETDPYVRATSQILVDWMTLAHSN